MKYIFSPFVLLLAFFSQPSLGYYKDELVFRSNISVMTSFQAKSDPFTNASGQPFPPNYEIDEISTDLHLSYGLVYSFYDRFTAVFSSSLPIFQNIYSNGIDVAQLKFKNPKISVQYYPKTRISALKTYVGCGFSYLDAHGAAPSDEFKNIVGSNWTNMEIDSALGYVFNLGFDFAVTNTMGINANIEYSLLSTDVVIQNLSVAPPLEINISNLRINPLVYGLGVYVTF